MARTRRSKDMELLRNLPVRSEPRCNICKSANRSRVDKLLAAGFSYISVAEELQVLDDEFKHKELDTIRKNVERHAKRHVNIKDRAVREIIERRALEQGIILDEATGQIATGRALLDLVVAKGTEQLTDPDMRVKVADAIEAVKMLEDVQKSEYLAQVEAMQKQVFCISRAVQELVPADLLPTIVHRAEELFRNPALLDNDRRAIERGR